MVDLTQFHRYKLEADNEIGIVYFLHGLADHVGRWEHLAKFLVERHISFYAHDQRGCGKTTLGIRVSETV